MQRHFADAEQVLDIFHALEHVADWGRAGFGSDSDAMRGWLTRAGRCLLADGWDGFCEFSVTGAGEVPHPTELQTGLSALIDYQAAHQNRLNSVLRLHRGQSVDSGLVEGTIKQRVNQRMKRSGARWRVEHVGHFVGFCAIADSPEWDHYWSSAA